MKFAKTYLQTMTDPSFPKEWREKGLEYKELKKLINGVVAELEALGLSAEVLRDLLEPPEQDQLQQTSIDSVPTTKRASSSRERHASSSSPNRSDSETSRYRHRSASSDGSGPSNFTSESEGTDELSGKLVAGLARLSTGRPAPSDFVDPLSPLMEEETARQRSIEGSMVIPPFAPGEAMPPAALPDDQIPSQRSAAGDWISNISRPESAMHDRGRGKKRSNRSASPGDETTGESSSKENSEGPTTGPSLQRLKHLEDGQEDRIEFLRASPMGMLGISQRRAVSIERSSSPVPDSHLLHPGSTTTSHKLGKKDLLEIRRSSHSGSVRPSFADKPRTSTASGDDSVEIDDEGHDWGGHAWRERQGLGWTTNDNSAKNSNDPFKKSQSAAAQNSSGASLKHAPKQGRWVQGKDGRRARAEYELAGTPEHPTPRIKLIIESPIHSDDEEDGSADSDAGVDDDDGRITELPPSAPGSRRGSAEEAKISSSLPEQKSSNEDDAPVSRPPQLMRTREIIIPLTADTEFLDTLTASLTKLSELQSTQRDTFVTSTEDLCASVARAASPYASKNDLYVWREIFQLWVDMQIFESQREKDRGELSVDESEARLKRFAEELAKRGWLAETGLPTTSPGSGSVRLSRSKKAMESALTLPMKSSKSASAVEDFLRLNLALLDVKKFQRVNVEAARKILKKHDKRTALTASSGLRDFVRQQEAARAFTMAMGGAAAMMGGGSGLPAESTGTLVAPAHGTHPSLAALLPSSTTGLLSESLPHILLSLLTTTLLPILPSVDDYSCAICTGLAWRPIRLDCSHLFCIRCLVKLQRQGKKNCPLCRAPDVVANADGRNMDEATVNMLRMWFPHEVDEKEQENDNDRKREELKDLGFEMHKCVVM